MLNRCLFILYFLLSSNAFAGDKGLFDKIVVPLSDTFLLENKLNGLFLLYRNDHYKPCAKSDAKFSEIVFYDKGVLVNFINISFINKRIEKFIHDSTTNEQTQGLLLNGIYHGIDKKGNNIIDVEYENGNIKYAVYYYPRQPNKKYILYDFTNQYNNMPYSHYIVDYYLDGSIKNEGYFFKVDNLGWARVLHKQKF